MNKDRNNINSEIWLCNNEIFPCEKNTTQTDYKERNKARHHKIKFYLIPVVVFLVVSIMFGSGVQEYEYKETINYVVVEGDTLWDISRRYLGKGYKYIQIVAENETGNPDLIYSGEVYKVTITHKVRVNN